MNPGEQMSPTASSLVLVCGNESLIIIIILIKQLLQNLHHRFFVRFLITQQSLIAKFLSTFYWPFIETYNSEITPTILRDSVFGLTRWRKNKIITIISHHIYDSQGPYLIIWFFSTIAGLGGFLVPILKNKYEVGEPLVISAVAVVVSQLIWLLPPSLNQPLPSSIEEAEALQTSDKKSCIVLWTYSP